MNNCFCMEQHVKKICSEAIYHLRNISKIHKYLTQDSAQIIIFLIFVIAVVVP